MTTVMYDGLLSDAKTVIENTEVFDMTSCNCQECQL